MSSLELNELRGTLSRNAQRSSQSLNLFHTAKAKSGITDETAAFTFTSVQKLNPDICSSEEAKKAVAVLNQHIAALLSEIQDSTLPPSRLKTLNDEINRDIMLRDRLLARSTNGATSLSRKKYQYFGAYQRPIKVTKAATVKHAEYATPEATDALYTGISQTEDSDSSVESSSDSSGFHEHEIGQEFVTIDKQKKVKVCADSTNVDALSGTEKMGICHKSRDRLPFSALLAPPLRRHFSPEYYGVYSTEEETELCRIEKEAEEKARQARHEMEEEKQKHEAQEKKELEARKHRLLMQYSSK